MANLNLNKVVLGGRICADPELEKTTTSDIPFTRFTVAVNRRHGKNGEAQTDFIRCTAWRQTAEFICNYFRKGSSICIVGQLQIRQWKDNEGNSRESAEIAVDEALFVDSKSDAQSASDYIPESYTKPTAPQMQPVSDNDLPF